MVNEEMDQNRIKLCMDIKAINKAPCMTTISPLLSPTHQFSPSEIINWSDAIVTPSTQKAII